MNCNKAADLMMKHMDSVLSRKEDEQLHKHCGLCPSCREDFALYSQMKEDFASDAFRDSEAELAPDGFESMVMEKIGALIREGGLPAAVSARVETVMCWVWGCFSILTGLAFLLAMNKEAIMAYLSEYPSFQSFVEMLTPMSRYVTEFTGNFSMVASDLLRSAMETASTLRYVFIAAFAALALAQYMIYRRGSGKATK